jgi:hypothetical protein
VMVCVAANVEPLIAAGRQPHHPSWPERFAAAPPAPENLTPVEMMAWRLRTPQGKKRYGRPRAADASQADGAPAGGQVLHLKN